MTLGVQPVPSTPLFGEQPKTAAPGGMGLNLFGNPPTTPNQSTLTQPGGFLGSKPTLNLGLGGASQQPGQPPALFGDAKPAQPATGGLFGAPQTMGQSTAPALFGGSTAPQPTGLFGQPTTQPAAGLGQSSLFGGSSLIGQQKPQGLFGNAPAPLIPSAPLQANVNASQSHFLPNSIFVFSNLQPKGISYTPTINGYKEFGATSDPSKAGDFSYLYQVPKQAEFSLSSTNPLNSAKIGDLQPHVFERIKKIDGCIRANQETVSALTNQASEVGLRSQKLGGELIKSAALEAKDLNNRIEQVSQRFGLAEREFQVLQSVVGHLKTQVPIYSKEYMPKMQFPSQALTLLSSSLTEKLESINSILSELIVFLESSADGHQTPEAQFIQYINIIDELFYFVRVLWARNQKVQEDLAIVRSRLFAGSKLGSGRSPMLIEDETPKRDINRTLSKIIEDSK